VRAQLPSNHVDAVLGPARRAKPHRPNLLAHLVPYPLPTARCSRLTAHCHI
jgi:hypothetical protein